MSDEDLPFDGLRRAAIQAIFALSDKERIQVLRCFCRGCHDYIGPDGVCYCERDE